MRIPTFTIGLLANLLMVGAVNAATVTLNFTAPNQNLSNGTYSENGFVVNVTGSSDGFIRNNALTNPLFNPNSIFSITREGGGLFEFLSFDYAADASFGGATDEIQLLGYESGAQTADFGTYSTGSTTYLTQMIANTILFDELRIVGTGVIRQAGPLLDNFVFNTDPGNHLSPVPIPAALPLFGTGLAAMAWFRRRKVKTDLAAG